MNVLLRILGYLKPYAKNLTVASVSMFLSVIFNMANVVLIIPFINILFDRQPPAAKPMPAFSLDTLKDWALTGMNNLLAGSDPYTILRWLCLFIVTSFVLKNVFQYLQSWFMAPAEQGIIRDVRNALYAHMHRLSLSYFSDEKKGGLISRVISDVRLLNDSAIAVLNSLFRDPPQIIVFTALLFLIDWQLTLVVFLLLPATGLFLTRIANWLHREGDKLQASLADLTSTLDEGLSSMRIVKAFRMEEYEMSRFRAHNRAYFKTYVSITRRKELASPITETLSVLVVVIILWFMGDSILSGRSGMTSGVFVAYIFAMLQMMQPLKSFGTTVAGVAQGMAGARRVFEVLDIEPRIVNRPDAVAITSFGKDIAFRDVRFRYDTGEEVLSGVELTIRAGQLVAIVGPSGAGKSTLVDLIPRFYDVTDGTILLDGRDIRDIRIESLRALMGIVTQETFLFNTTIRDNIAYGESAIAFENVVAAARAANAHEFIIEQAEGYETVIGERGVKLSGGQRQRIAIARAILKNPPILILDEATSALDTESELLVQSAVERLMEGRTSIVIAHRLSTIQRADVIYVIDGGRIREAGRHEDLMRNGAGVYRRLYDLQFKL